MPGSQERHQSDVFGLPPVPGRLAVYGFVLCLLTAAVLPACRTPPQDSFPFSNYPMFARRKPDRLHLAQVLAVEHPGEPRERAWAIEPRLATGNREVLQAKGIIEDAIRTRRSASLCHQVRVRTQNEASTASAQEFRVVTSLFDVTKYFESDRKPLRVHVHARCQRGRR